MVAVPLIFGRLTADDYEDEVARDPRIDALRAKMVVTENRDFSRDYLDPDKRAIGNALRVFFRDGARTARVAIDYPSAIAGGAPKASRCCSRSSARALARISPRRNRARSSRRAQKQETLEEMAVDDFVSLWVTAS
jgi:2-methylcitrate dehydratase